MPDLNQQFAEHVDFIECLLDDVVNTGSDDDLFIASYLQGHLALVAKPMEVLPQASLQDLDLALTHSLQQAFDKNELNTADQQKVSVLWQECLDKCRQ